MFPSPPLLLLRWASKSDRIHLHYPYLFVLHYSRGCAALNMGILIVTGLLLLLGTSSMFLVFHNGFQDLLWPKHATMPSVVDQRKLKEGSPDLSSSVDYERDLSKLNFKDYRIVDPIPGTPGTTGSGTIEHGAPLNPWTRTKGPHPPPSHF